jgi:predicted nucleic acid-binding protein
MSFLLDTDICSAHLKGVGAVTGRLLQYTGRLHVSVVTTAELYTWAFRSNAPPRRYAALVDLFDDVVVLDLDRAVAQTFGRLRAALLDGGRSTPSMDLLIAATAIENGLTLVTHNRRTLRPSQAYPWWIGWPDELRGVPPEWAHAPRDGATARA